MDNQYPRLVKCNNGGIAFVPFMRQAIQQQKILVDGKVQFSPIIVRYFRCPFCQTIFSYDNAMKIWTNKKGGTMTVVEHCHKTDTCNNKLKCNPFKCSE